MSIKTSIGTSTANSYVSVTDADSYFSTRNISTSWSNILSNSTGTLQATTVKENYLIQATREIDYNFKFFESKYNQGIIGSSDYQVLEFPRSSNTDADGDLYIPQEVKDSTCEQALWILERGNVKTTNEGQVIERQIISSECKQWLSKWINRRGYGYGAWRD